MNDPAITSVGNIVTLTETIYETLRPYTIDGEMTVGTLCRIIGEWQAGKKEYEELSQEVQRLQGIIQKERAAMKENVTPMEGLEEGRSRADYVDELYELREALNGALQLQKYLIRYAYR